MRPEGAGGRRWGQVAVVVWGILLAAVCCRVLMRPGGHNVFVVYAGAAASWCAGNDVYCEANEGYRYSPFATVSLMPFGALGERWGSVAWRLANAAVLLGGMTWWSRSVLPAGLGPTRRAAVAALAAPLAVGNLNNGQCNPLVIGLLLLAVAASAESWWNTAASCVAAAALFKVYPLAVGLLLVAAYPRQLGGRLPVALAAGVVMPFLFQAPEYVARQYAGWLAVLRADDRAGLATTVCYRDLWLLCRLARLPVSRDAYALIQGVAAAGVAGLCWAGRRNGWPRRRLLARVLNLGVCWMLLCGPATESATYILLAPTAAWAVVDAGGRRQGLTGALPLVAYALLVLCAAAAWFPGVARVHAVGLQPAAAVVLVVALARHLWYRFEAPGAPILLGPASPTA